MVAGFLARISELERRHGNQHRSPYQFDNVTFVSCKLQQVLSMEKTRNIVGNIVATSQNTDSCAADIHSIGTVSIISRSLFVCHRADKLILKYASR